MAVRMTSLLLLSWFVFADASQAGPPRTARYGDPLPPGALARLGTTRMRPGTVPSEVIGAIRPDWPVRSGSDGQGIDCIAPLHTHTPGTKAPADVRAGGDGRVVS